MQGNEFEDNDKVFLAELKSGNATAFEELYARYWKKLYQLAYQKLYSHDAAEEVVQDVFVIIWEKRESLEVKCLSSYLAAMTRYAVYRYLARQETSAANESQYYRQHVRNIPLQEQIENKWLLDKIASFSDRLPEKCRLVFKYSKLEDLSLREVAQKLNISQKTAEAHLTKALKLIRLNLRSFLTLFL